jgi:hypothetical protein
MAGKGWESDIDEEWLSIQKSLRNDGVSVVSQKDALTNPEYARTALYIQLFSTLDPLDRARSEFEAGAVSYPANHVLQWRKSLPNQRVDLELLNSLDDEDRRFCETEYVETGPFEEFKERVRDRLDAQRGEQEERPLIYITFDRSNELDDGYATKLNEVAREIADVALMREKSPAPQFLGALRKATGFVFLYGDTSSSFIERWMGTYVSGRRGIKTTVKRAALFQAPPGNKDKCGVEPRIGLKPAEWSKYGSRVELRLQDIVSYCLDLQTRSALESRRDRD